MRRRSACQLIAVEARQCRNKQPLSVGVGGYDWSVTGSAMHSICNKNSGVHCNGAEDNRGGHCHCPHCTHQGSPWSSDGDATKIQREHPLVGGASRDCGGPPSTTRGLSIRGGGCANPGGASHCRRASVSRREPIWLLQVSRAIGQIWLGDVTHGEVKLGIYIKNQCPWDTRIFWGAKIIPPHNSPTSGNGLSLR